MQREFEERVRAIAPHGLGLSVDVYSPDLVELDATDAHLEIVPNLLTVVLPDRPPYPPGSKLLDRSRLRKLREAVTLLALGILTSHTFTQRLNAAGTTPKACRNTERFSRGIEIS